MGRRETQQVTMGTAGRSLWSLLLQGSLCAESSLPGSLFDRQNVAFLVA